MSLWTKTTICGPEGHSLYGLSGRVDDRLRLVCLNMRGPFAAGADRSVFCSAIEPPAVPHRRGNQASAIAPLENDPRG